LNQQEEATDRPAASGHRFGPDLACSECGIGWDEHQRDPHPCKTGTEGEAFNRRPSTTAVPPVGKASSALATPSATSAVRSVDPSAPELPDKRDPGRKPAKARDSADGASANPPRTKN